MATPDPASNRMHMMAAQEAIQKAIAELTRAAAYARDAEASEAAMASISGLEIALTYIGAQISLLTN